MVAEEDVMTRDTTRVGRHLGNTHFVSQTIHIVTVCAGPKTIARCCFYFCRSVHSFYSLCRYVLCCVGFLIRVSGSHTRFTVIVLMSSHQVCLTVSQSLNVSVHNVFLKLELVFRALLATNTQAHILKLTITLAFFKVFD